LRDGVTPNMVLTYLANRAGLVNTKEVLTLTELVEQFNKIPAHDVVINEEQMLEELRG
jgi:hypothetical protein